MMYPILNCSKTATMLCIFLLLSGLSHVLAENEVLAITPTSSPQLSSQPGFKPSEQPPAPYPARPNYPYFEGYGYDAFYPHQKPQPVYQEPSSYMSSLIPATQSALQFTLRVLAKFGMFLVGGAAFVLVGGIFTTALCSLTPICVISFPGFTGIDKESVRSMMTPDRISAAAAMVQDAIGKYQRLQRAVGK